MFLLKKFLLLVSFIFSTAKSRALLLQINRQRRAVAFASDNKVFSI